MRTKYFAKLIADDQSHSDWFAFDCDNFSNIKSIRKWATGRGGGNYRCEVYEDYGDSYGDFPIYTWHYNRNGRKDKKDI